MRVRALRLSGFACYGEEQEILFPDIGLTLITGRNGQGKSSLAVAVGWGVWGKTPSGSVPWPAEQSQPCQVRVLIDGDDGGTKFDIHRVRAAGVGRIGADTWPGEFWGKHVVWPTRAPVLDHFESTKHAQALIQQWIGLPWVVWRNACLIRSADKVTFASATDAERKRLVEELFGLDAFDRALTAARAAKRTVDDAVAVARSEVAVKSAAHQQALASALTLDMRLIDLGFLVAEASARTAADQRAEAAAAWEVAVRCDDEVHARLDVVCVTETRARERLSAALRVLVSAKAGNCSVCGQAVPVGRIASAAEEYAVLDKVCAEAVAAATRVRREADEVSQTTRIARRALDDAEIRLVEIKSAGSLSAAAAEARQAVMAAERGRTQAQSVLDAEKAEQLVQEGCVDVLGVRGARAGLMTGVLHDLTMWGNHYLEALAGGGLTLELKATTDLKSGATADKISLDVRGAGGGRGYMAASDGERRRIDLALTLAVRSAVCGVRGAQGSTLFCDEVFDNLDVEGAARAAQVLRDLSKTCHVVVVSHDRNLQDLLQADRHVSVEGGVLTWL